MARVHAEMNLTPLIDILLVLLVIFMAALPLTQKGIDTQLPAQTQNPQTPPPPDQIVLEYAADGRISINRSDVGFAELEMRLRDIYAPRTNKTLYISGAPTLRYQAIIDVIDAAKGAGIDRVGIITAGMRKGS